MILRLNSWWRVGQSRGFRDQSGLGEAAVDQLRAVLDTLALDHAGEVVDVGGALGGSSPRAEGSRPCHVSGGCQDLLP